jgi:hypothetical protein
MCGDVLDQEGAEGLDEHAGDIEEQADHSEDIYEFDELVEKALTEYANREDREDDPEIFTEEGFQGEHVIDEALAELKAGQDGNIDPEIAVQLYAVTLFDKPEGQKCDGGEEKHFNGCIEERIGGYTNEEEHGDPIDPGLIFICGDPLHG